MQSNPAPPTMDYSTQTSLVQRPRHSQNGFRIGKKTAKNRFSEPNILEFIRQQQREANFDDTNGALLLIPTQNSGLDDGGQQYQYDLAVSDSAQVVPRVEVNEPTTSEAEVLALHNQRVRPILDAILTRAAFNEYEALLQEGRVTDQALKSAYVHLLTFGATNNFAAIGNSVPPEVMFDALKDIMMALLQDRTVSVFVKGSLPDRLSMRPMTETFFKCAIEKGDHIAVRAVLNWKEAGIDVNGQICSISEKQYTPVERAALLEHLEVTKVLIEAGADVNKTHGVIWKGALECVFGKRIPWSQPSTELLIVLVQAGSRIRAEALVSFLRQGKVQAPELKILLRTKFEPQNWLNCGVFHEATYQLPETAVLDMLRLLYSLNPRLTRLYSSIEDGENFPRYPPRLIDIAAQQKHTNVFRYLRSVGAPVTADTMTAAARSGDTTILAQIFDAPVSLMDCFSPHYGSTPWAEAILTRQHQVADLILLNHDCAGHMTNDVFCASLAAAAEVGDVDLVQYFIKGSESRDRIKKLFGWALLSAVEANQTKSAIALLEAGAEIDGLEYLRGTGFRKGRDILLKAELWESILLKAVRNQNKVLVQALLDHDMHDWLTDSHWRMDELLMQAAVEWGDHSMIGILTSMGISPNVGIYTAVRKQDKNLLQLLLDSGGSVSYVGTHSGVSPLHLAVLTEDLDMVRELIRRGADPLKCRSSLWEAMEATPTIMQELLDECRRKYPNPHGNYEFNVEILDWAIEADRSELVKWLLGSGFTGRVPCGIDLPIRLPLFSAIFSSKGNNTDLVQLLLNAGYGPNEVEPVFDRHCLVQASSSVRTALLAAIETRNCRMVQCLLNNGADVNRPANGGVKRTPLQLAAEIGCKAMVKQLLDQGADIHAPPAVRGGGTPIQLAAIGGYIGIVELLVEYGDDFRAPPCKVHGCTALEGAAAYGRYDMVKYLLNLGEHERPQYDSAMKCARHNGHQSVEELIKTAKRELLDPVPAPLPTLFENISLVAEEPLGDMVDETADEDDSDQQAAGCSGAYQCSTCQEHLKNASSLMRHQRTVHWKEARFTCDICSKGFGRKDTFKRHRRAHNGDIYPCPYCPKGYSRTDTLKNHLKDCKKGA